MVPQYSTQIDATDNDSGPSLPKQPNTCGLRRTPEYCCIGKFNDQHRPYGRNRDGFQVYRMTSRHANHWTIIDFIHNIDDYKIHPIASFLLRRF
jgi:hypothetical protein